MIGVDHDKLAGFVGYEHRHQDGLIGIVPTFLRTPLTQVGTNWTGMSFGQVDFGNGTSGTVYLSTGFVPNYCLGFTYIVELDVGWTGPSDLYLRFCDWPFATAVTKLYKTEYGVNPGDVVSGFVQGFESVRSGWSFLTRMSVAGAKIKSALVVPLLREIS